MLDPEKAGKCSIPTLKKVAALLGKSIEEVIGSQELLSIKKKSRSLNENDFEKGLKKLKICPNCFQKDDTGESVSTFYIDSNYEHCIKCGEKLISQCSKGHPIIAPEHNCCPFCGEKYPTKSKIQLYCCGCSIKETIPIDWSIIDKRLANCPRCKSPFPYFINVKEEHPSITISLDNTLWIKYSNKEAQTREQFYRLYPLYAVNPNLSKEYEIYCWMHDCAEVLNKAWKVPYYHYSKVSHCFTFNASESYSSIHKEVFFGDSINIKVPPNHEFITAAKFFNLISAQTNPNKTPKWNKLELFNKEFKGKSKETTPLQMLYRYKKIMGEESEL